MERTVWARMPVAALLLSLIGAAPCAAQPPGPPSTIPPAANRSGVGSGTLPPSPARSTASPAVGPAVGPGGQDVPPALPILPGGPERRDGATGESTPNPLATGLGLKPAPTEPSDLRFPINLATALRLSDARPLMVAAAQAGVWVAEAQLTRAKLLWIPTLNIGFDYIRHDGGGPDFNKGIMTAPSLNFFYGGVGAVGNIPTTDAIFQPLAMRQSSIPVSWISRLRRTTPCF